MATPAQVPARGTHGGTAALALTASPARGFETAKGGLKGCFNTPKPNEFALFGGVDKTTPMLYSKRMAIIVFYRNENGRMPVKESLEELSSPDQAKAAAHLSLLEEYGHTLREPHVKTLKEGLKELRFKISAGQYRIFFFFHVGDTVVLLHTLQKKTQETPKQDIKLALKRIKDWQEMHGG